MQAPVKDSGKQLSKEDMDKILENLGGKTPTSDERFKKALVMPNIRFKPL
jgi:hypothetical protein